MSASPVARLRRLGLWATLVWLGLLVVLSIIGAFLGVDRARSFFNSPVLTVFWIFWIILLLAGILLFKRLRRHPGLVGIHLGTVLIILGALLGSDKGHLLLGGAAPKTAFGYMSISEGRTDNRITTQDTRTAIGNLPFSIRLNDFFIEYYEPENAACVLYLRLPNADAGGSSHQMQKRIEWTAGAETAIPFTAARLTVLNYLPYARPVFGNGDALVLEVSDPDLETVRIPASVGAEFEFKNGRGRISQVFAHLIVQGRGSDRQVIDMPGLHDNPALKVDLTYKDGKQETRYVMERFPMHGAPESGLVLRYAQPEPTGAAPSEDGLPAMELLIKNGAKKLQTWTFFRSSDERFVELTLGEVLGTAPVPDGHTHAAAAPSLFIVRPVGQVRDYKSDLSVMEEGREVLRKVIEVNDPLHYGGYDFYQHSYDSEREQLTVLSVRSDTGLWTVYAGFILLCLGTFTWCWIQPIIRNLEKPKEGNGA